MRFQFKLLHKVLLVVALPVIFQLAYLGFLTNALNEFANYQDQEQEQTQTILLADRLCLDIPQRMMLMALYRATLNPIYRTKFFQTSAEIQADYQHLADIYKDDADKHKAIVISSQMVHAAGNELQSLMDEGEREKHFSGMFGSDRNIALLSWSLHRAKGKKHTMGKFADKVFEEEKTAQEEMMQHIEKLQSSLANALLLGLVASVSLALVSGFFFSISISTRLKRVLLNIKSIEENTFDLQPAGGTDEIGKLDLVIRGTAKEIRDVQQFQAHTVQIVADELERPLAMLRSSFDSLTQTGFEALTEKGALRLEQTTREITRLRRLVSELALINAVKTSQLDLDIKQIDLANTAKTAVEIVSDFARSKKVRINCAAISSTAFADENRILQVVVNLLSNAIKFSPVNGDVTVNVSQLNDFVRITVADQGPGIDDGFKGKIFSSFEQASRSDAIEKKGSGLGLAISKKIVEQHAGQIGFDTKIGEGTTFWLTLPAKPPAQTDLAISQPTSSGEQARRSWRPSLWKTAIILIALPLLVQLITIGSLYTVLNSVNENMSGYARAHKIATVYFDIVDELVNAFFSAILFNVTQQESHRQGAVTWHKSVRSALAQLDALEAVRGDSSLGMHKLVDDNIKMHEEILQAPQDADTDPWLGPKNVARTENILLQAQKPLQGAMQHEQELMDSRTLASEGTRSALNLVLLSSAILSGLVSAGLALFIARRLSSRTNVVLEKTVRLARRAPLEQPLQGDDEFAFLDRSLYVAANKLAELEQVRQEMVSVSSHELRTPLTSLMVLCELVQVGGFGPLTSDGTLLIAEIHETIGDLISMITNLLDLEKIQSGKMLVHKESTELDSILESVVSHLIPLAQNRNIEVISGRTTLTAEIDKERIVQVLTCIIREILEELPAKSRVTLECLGEKYRVSIRITVPRPEISAKEQHAGRQRLAIDLTKLIAEQHGGQLLIRSTQDTRTLTISLPAAA